MFGKRFSYGLVCLLGAAAGCGDGSGGESVDTSLTPLVGGSGIQAVTRPSSPDRFQSETAIAISGTRTVIAYNDEDGPTHVTIAPDGQSKTISQGFSIAGYSQGGPAYSHRKIFPTDPNWVVYYGDPSIAAAGSTANVYFTNAAINKNKPRNPPIAFPLPGNEVASALSGACVFRSTNNGRTFSLFQCLSNAFHFYDGSAMASSPDGRAVYAAFQDMDDQATDVWLADGVSGSAFQRLLRPFDSLHVSIMSHPRLYATAEGLYALAVDGSSQLWLARRATNSSPIAPWDPPVLVANDAAGNHEIPLVGSTSPVSLNYLSQNGGYTFAVGPTESNRAVMEARIFYVHPRGLPSTRFSLKGVYCRLPLSSCTTPPEWTTSPETRPVSPALAFHDDGFNAPRWMVTFQSSVGLAGNDVALWEGVFAGGNPPNPDTLTLQQVTMAQTPCPFTSPSGRKTNYWGDYDYMVADSSGVFLRSITDSTGAACTGNAVSAHPQHISLVTLF